MSQEIDERVVEMRFDNAQFERNTRQSIKTLNALNESLKLEGAEKSFEKIEDASAKVDFDKMQSALESLNSKFSAVEVMGVTALMHITNQAMDTGEKLVKSLSIDQVTSGWNKYAQKTASVQTIMNATGKSITKVNGYLEKLMWFSDETSYGFTDMTSALSTLTAAGGDIEKMIPMIMGMANATAYAGKGAAEFQRVIYNLAQSYGTGAIQLIDWKSVEQAGVASQQLKQLLIDTGVELGKIKKGAVTTGTFDNSLQKKWADKEVMETAFGKYAEFSNAVKEMVDANPGMLATQAIEALADQYDEVSVKAFKAAQEAKSFSEAVDATKDAVSSGWMETFDILFGNYEEAKGFWSDLAEEFWTMFAGGAAGRNNWLKSAFDSGLDQLLGTDGFGNAGDNYTQLLEKSLVKTGLLTQDAIDDAGSFQKALEESGVTTQQLESVIDDSADGYAKLLELSDAELKKKNLSREGVKKLADAYAAMAEKIQNGSVDLDEFSGKMNQLSGREHFFNGILNILDGINSVLEPIRGAFGEVFMTDGSPLYNFLKGFDELTGKMQLSEAAAQKVQKVFKGFFSVLNIGFKAVKVTVKAVFAIFAKLLNILSPVTDLLLGIGSRIGEVLAWADQSMGKAESLTDVLAILVGAIGALVSPIGEVLSGFRSIVRGGSVEDAKQQFGGFAAVVNAVGGVLEKFKIGSVSASGIIGKAVTVLGGILTLAFDGMGAVIGSAFSGFQDAGKTIEDFKESHVPMLENIRDAVLSIPEKAEAALKNFGGTLGSVMSTISSACQKALDAVKGFFNLQDGVDLYRLLALLDVGALALGIYGVAKALSSLNSSMKKMIANPLTDLLTSMKGAVDAWTKEHTTNNFVSTAKGIATAVGIISASMYLLSRIDNPVMAVQALVSVLTTLFGMVVALRVLGKADLTGLDTAKLLGTVTAISIGMAVLASAVSKLGKMDARRLENSIDAVGHIAAVLAGMTGLLALFNKQLGGVTGASGFVAAAAAVDMIALALIPLAKAEESGLDIDGAVKAINGVAIAMSVLMVASGFAQKLSGSTKENTIDKIIKYLVKLGGMLIAINAMGSALLMAAGAVAIFASLGDNLKTGLIGAAVMIAEVAVALGVLSKLKLNPTRMKKAASAMLTASAALTVMAAAAALMGKAVKSDGGNGFVVMSIGLAELAGAMYLLGKNSMGNAAAATAMVAMGAALIEMAWAINMLAGVGLADLAKGILTMTASLAVLAAGIGWLSASAAGIVSLAGACLMLATALLILTPAFKGLASLTVGEAFAGVISMIGILIGLFAVGSIAPVATGMTVFSACLISMAKAFSIFAGGIIKLSIATAILTILAAFAGPLREVIVTAADDIEAALTAIITAICNTITNCEEPLEAAIVSLCKILIQSIVDLIGWAWDGNGEGGGIKCALDELWANFLAWADEHASELSKQFNPVDLANAKEQYDTLKAQYGEQDLRTLEAYNDLLDAQTEAAQLQADIANQELELIEAQIDAISSAQSRMQTRMDILSTAYDDGSLSERESAYEQAVEQYGKDSEEARKARFQGTTSAILSTVTALKNLNFQMQQTNKLQAELAKLTPGTETYDSKQSEILSSKSSFIGFASNLADALNMEDTGKRAMLIFANSIQDHWGEVSKAFQSVMTKVSAGMSEGMKQTFSDAFGWMSSDEGIQMETEFISAISSALQGDWGGAVASAFAFGMDLAFSEAGAKAREWVAKLFAKDILPGIQNGSGQLTEVIGQAMGAIGTMAQGSGGVVETLGNIGTVLGNVGGVLMSFLSEFWWVFLIVGAIAAVIGGIAWYANKKKQSQGSGIYDVGKDLNKDFADGVEDGFDDVDDAVTDMTENAVDIARGALSTIDRVMGDDYEYTPQITPVVDLSNVIESADEATGAFEATTKAMTLDDDVSRKMAAQIEAQAEIQNGLKASANNETLSAINALGAHMDSVAQSIKGMSVNINGRKTIGYIDSEMGRRVAAKVR